MNVYLLVLTGQGDTEIKVVDKETWGWIFGPSGRPETGKSGWDDPFVPAYQREKILADRRENEGPSDEDDEEGDRDVIRITSGSWQNDRALLAYSSERYKAETYYSIESAMRAITNLGDAIVEEFDGYIY